MSTVTSMSIKQRNALLRLTVIGGLIIGTANAIIYHWFVLSVLGGSPLTSVYQYIASGALVKLPLLAASPPLCSECSITSSWPFSSLLFLS